MKTTPFTVACLVVAGSALLADEGMWRIDQLPIEVIARRYAVHLTPADLERLRYAPVRLQFGDGGGTGTFMSANGLMLTNHHVALDCIRTSTLPTSRRQRPSGRRPTSAPIVAQATDAMDGHRSLATEHRWLKNV